MTELRAADLRFTPSEAAEFLDKVMDLPSRQKRSLTGRPNRRLDRRPQLAALSMQGHSDVAGFIQAFAGDNRYIVDYLIEEVLGRQPEALRSFLLQTCILDRLSGPLCDAVTEQEDSSPRLETLQRGNFFLIPLDDTRHWYRYHHLFADVLQMHLKTEQPDQVPILHRRASEWYQQNGLPSDAIRHALAGSDFERAAGLIELAAPAMHRIRQEATVFAWMKALPDEVFRARPVLSVLYVAAMMSNGEIEGVEDRLRDAEQWLDMMDEMHERPAEMVVVNEEEFRRLPGAIAMYRAGLALARGDVPDTMTYAGQVLDIVPEDDHRESRSGSGAHGACLLDERGSRDRAPHVCRGHGSLADGGEYL